MLEIRAIMNHLYLDDLYRLFVVTLWLDAGAGLKTSKLHTFEVSHLLKRPGTLKLKITQALDFKVGG